MGDGEIVDHCQFREDRQCCSLLTLQFPNSLDIIVSLLSSAGAQAWSHGATVAEGGHRDTLVTNFLFFLVSSFLLPIPGWVVNGRGAGRERCMGTEVTQACFCHLRAPWTAFCSMPLSI